METLQFVRLTHPLCQQVPPTSVFDCLALPIPTATSDSQHPDGSSSSLASFTQGGGTRTG